MSEKENLDNLSPQDIKEIEEYKKYLEGKMIGVERLKYEGWTEEELRKKVVILENRIKKSHKETHNIRRYSIVYTPIAEGCTDVLRVLKGRDKND